MTILFIIGLIIIFALVMFGVFLLTLVAKDIFFGEFLYEEGKNN
jgi:hypothetical protein